MQPLNFLDKTGIDLLPLKLNELVMEIQNMYGKFNIYTLLYIKLVYGKQYIHSAYRNSGKFDHSRAQNQNKEMKVAGSVLLSVHVR